MAQDEAEQVKPMLVALAEAVAEWFPELEGRSIAVSEVDPFSDKTNVPSLPLAFVALVQEAGAQSTNGGGRIAIEEDVVLSFMFKPAKYKRVDGQETPFFAFYNYELIRNRLLAKLHNWRTPSNGGISYRTLDVESDEYAVTLTFRFRTSFNWCAPSDGEAYDVQLVARPLLIPAGVDPACVDMEQRCPEEPDPCDFARERNPFGINDKPFDFKG